MESCYLHCWLYKLKNTEVHENCLFFVEWMQVWKWGLRKLYMSLVLLLIVFVVRGQVYTWVALLIALPLAAIKLIPLDLEHVWILFYFFYVVQVLPFIIKNTIHFKWLILAMNNGICMNYYLSPWKKYRRWWLAITLLMGVFIKLGHSKCVSVSCLSVVSISRWRPCYPLP